MNALASFPSATNCPLLETVRPAGCRLRPARDRDMVFLRRLYRHLRAAEVATVDWPAAQKNAFCDMQFDAQHTDWTARFAKAWFLVVTHRSAPIGRFYVDPGGDEVRVIDIALLPEWRGKGIGAALLNALADWAAPRPVVLQVQFGSRAQQLYARLGFVEYARQDGRVQMALRRADS